LLPPTLASSRSRARSRLTALQCCRGSSIGTHTLTPSCPRRPQAPRFSCVFWLLLLSASSSPSRALVPNPGEAEVEGVAEARVRQAAPPARAVVAVRQDQLSRQLHPARRHPAWPIPLPIRSATTLTPTRRRACSLERRLPSPGPAAHLAPMILVSETSRRRRAPLLGDPAPPKARTAMAMPSAWRCGPRKARGCRATHGPTPATRRGCRHAGLRNELLPHAGHTLHGS
jgi:hypothetical protein